MTNDLTTEELRKLAELCGFREWKKDKSIFIRGYGNNVLHITKAEWRPHRDIAQAIMVAEAVFGYYELKRAKLNGAWFYYFEGFYKVNDGVLVSAGEADTPALAICRGALAAKEA